MKTTTPLLVAVLLLLLVAIAWFWAPWRDTPAPGSGDATGGLDAAAVQADARAPNEADVGVSEAGRDAKTARRVEVPVEVHTAVRGAFLAPHGAWPGGGEVALVPTADKSASNPMRMFSMGMEQARKARKRQLAGVSGGGAPPDEVARMLGLAPPVATAAVDGRGMFTIPNPPPGRFGVRLTHPLLRATEMPVDVVRGEVTEVGVVQTEAAGSLLILVADARGQPIEGANLELHRSIDRSRFLDPAARGNMMGLIRKILPKSARTDARGAHVYAGIDLRDAWYLEVYHPDFAKEFRVVDLLPGRQTVLHVEMGRGPALSVAVTLPDGAPCPRARLELTFEDFRYPTGYQRPGAGGKPGPLVRSFDLPADGEQVLRGLYLGRVLVEVSTPGYFPQQKTVRLPGDGEPPHLAFKLEEGLTITGRILDQATGEPVAGAKVMSVGEMARGPLGIDMSSLLSDVVALEVVRHGIPADDQGEFRVGGLKGGERARLIAIAAGYDTGEAKGIAAGSGGVEIRLQKFAKVRGRVLAEHSGAPVEAFTVTLEEKAFLVVDKNVAREDYTGRTDGSFVLEEAPRGSYKITITTPGFSPWTGRVDLRKGDADLGEVRLPPPSSIAGVVLDPHGRPVDKATVSLVRGGLMDQMAQASGFGLDGVETDAEGKFHLTPIEGRRVRLLVVKPGLAPTKTEPIALQRGKVTEGVVVNLSAGGSLRGTVVDASGNPLQDWRVQASHNRGQGMHITKTDADGAFRIEGMASGAHKIDCMSMSKMSKMAEMGGVRSGARKVSDLQGFDVGKMIANAMKNTVTDRVVIEDGQASEIELVWKGEEDAAQVEGLVRVEGSVRLGGAELARGMVFMAPAGSTSLGQVAQISNGRFTVDGVLPGSYRCRVQATVLSGTLGRPQVVEVSRSEAAVFRLELKLPGGELRGRVIGVDGEIPHEGVILSLSSRGASAPTMDRMEFGEGTVLSGKDGSFAFRGLAPGRYAIFAKEASGRRGARLSGSSSGLELAADQVKTGLVVRLDAGGSLRVQVMDAHGARGNAMVTLLGPTGQPTTLFPRSLTNRDGVVHWLGIPSGDYRVAVDAPQVASRISAPFEISRGVEQRLSVELVPGIPVEAAVGRGVDPPEAGERVLYTIWRADGMRLRSGSLTVPGPKVPWRIGRFAPGTYKVRVESARFGVVTTQQTVPGKGVGKWVLER